MKTAEMRAENHLEDDGWKTGGAEINLVGIFSNNLLKYELVCTTYL